MKNSLNKKVVVTIKMGKEYLGTLRGFDEYNNLYLEDVEDVESGEKVGNTIFKGGNLTNIQKYEKKN